MLGNFDKCLDMALKHEGGYVNHPNDPGGETNLGISKRSYPREDIKGMTRKRAGEIYKRDYWDAVSGDLLPSGIDYVAFDAAINSGVSRGAKWMQRAVGVTQDGRIGPETIKACFECDAINVINRACTYRLSFLQNLNTWGSFGRGWQRRVDGVRAVALDMIDIKAPTAPTPTVNIGWYGIIDAIMRFFK